MPARTKKTLAPEDLIRFERDGYCVVENAIDADTLAMLRRESDAAVAWQEAAIAQNAPGIEMLNRLGHRYFVPRRSLVSKDLTRFLTSRHIVELCAPVLGKDAYLFLEVFIHKNPGSDSDFKWHQDHGYISYYGFGHFPPNLSVWVPLDDVRADNGALVVKPFTEGVPPTPIPHAFDEATSDCFVALDGEAGHCVEMRAGDLLLLSGLVLHRSGPNRTERPRRAYQFQYSRQPLLADAKPVMLATQVLADGRFVGADADITPEG